MTASHQISRPQKVLLALYELSEGGKKRVKFEDIVVKLFKDYPAEFHLRGYKEYPDSGDLVHKPLYEAKKKGLVSSGNKVFSLTARGVSVAEQIKDAAAGKKVSTSNRLSRDVQKEVDRVLALDGFRQLFVGGNEDEIIDTDFYSYLGVTVRTSRNDFAGRVETMKNMIERLTSLESDARQPIYDKIVEYHNFLLRKFEDQLTYKANS